MSIRPFLVATLSSAILLTGAAASAQEELKNDGFADGGTAAFQSGFVAGEMAASRFTPPAPDLTVVKVQLLFGGDANGVQQNIKLFIWDDSALTDEPGDELYTAEYTLTSADDALQELDLTGGNFTVPGPFRVGVQLTHDGLPSVARDDDGTIAPDKNFLFADGLGWNQSADLGVTGDWILRAFVDTAAGGSGGSGGSGGTGGSGGAGGTGGSPATTSSTTTDSSGGAGGTGGSGGSGGSGGATTDEETGCNCRSAGSPTAPPEGALFTALAAALLFTTRRRRPTR